MKQRRRVNRHWLMTRLLWDLVFRQKTQSKARNQKPFSSAEPRHNGGRENKDAHAGTHFIFWWICSTQSASLTWVQLSVLGWKLWPQEMNLSFISLCGKERVSIITMKTSRTDSAGESFLRSSLKSRYAGEQREQKHKMKHHCCTQETSENV